jgi:hypothetical protein
MIELRNRSSLPQAAAEPPGMKRVGRMTAYRSFVRNQMMRNLRQILG